MLAAGWSHAPRDKILRLIAWRPPRLRRLPSPDLVGQTVSRLREGLSLRTDSYIRSSGANLGAIVVGNGGLTGVHTVLKPGPDDDFQWPIGIDAPHKPFPHDRWDTDRDEDPLPGAKFAFKSYELKLLVTLAHCFRGTKTFSDLPMIPLEIADLINRQGGLQEWPRNSESRLERFRKIVEEQEKGTNLRSKSELRRRGKRR